MPGVSSKHMSEITEPVSRRHTPVTIPKLHTFDKTLNTNQHPTPKYIPLPPSKNSTGAGTTAEELLDNMSNISGSSTIEQMVTGEDAIQYFISNIDRKSVV